MTTIISIAKMAMVFGVGFISTIAIMVIVGMYYKIKSKLKTEEEREYEFDFMLCKERIQYQNREILEEAKKRRIN